jgi:hypothetical protein
LQTLRPGCMMHSGGSGALPARTSRTCGGGRSVWGLGPRAAARVARARWRPQVEEGQTGGRGRAGAGRWPRAAGGLLAATHVVLKLERVEGGLVALDRAPRPVDQELGVVPLDVAAAAAGLAGQRHGLLRLEVLVERVGGGAVDLQLVLRGG